MYALPVVLMFFHDTQNEWQYKCKCQQVSATGVLNIPGQEEQRRKGKDKEILHRLTVLGLWFFCIQLNKILTTAYVHKLHNYFSLGGVH